LADDAIEKAALCFPSLRGHQRIIFERLAESKGEQSGMIPRSHRRPFLPAAFFMAVKGYN